LVFKLLQEYFCENGKEMTKMYVCDGGCDKDEGACKKIVTARKNNLSYGYFCGSDGDCANGLKCKNGNVATPFEQKVSSFCYWSI